MPKAADPIDRFFTHVRLASYVGGCAEWTGYRNPDGYGMINTGSRTDGSRRTIGAHRFAWEMLRGPVPAGLQVCHKCDNPACVEPSHLWLGTFADNMKDKVAKGRQSTARGAAHPMWKGGAATKKQRNRDGKRLKYNTDPAYRAVILERLRARNAVRP